MDEEGVAMLPAQIPAEEVVHFLFFVASSFEPDLDIVPFTALVQALLNLMEIYQFSPSAVRQRFLQHCEQYNQAPILLVPAIESCPECKRRLGRAYDPSGVTVYGREGTLRGLSYKKRCTNKKHCNVRVTYDSYTCNGKKIRILSETQQYLLVTNVTAFEKEWLNQVDSQMLFGHCAFEAVTNMYNRDHSHEISSADRNSLNRQRLAEAWLLHTFLLFIAMTEVDLVTINFHKSLDENISEHLDAFKAAFETRYAGHVCCTPGCGRFTVTSSVAA